MPTLPISPHRVAWEFPLTSFTEYGLRVHVEEACSVLRIDGSLWDELAAPAWGDRTRLG